MDLQLRSSSGPSVDSSSLVSRHGVLHPRPLGGVGQRWSSCDYGNFASMSQNSSNDRFPWFQCILSGSAMCIASCILVEIFFRYATVARLHVYHIMTSHTMIPIMAAINVLSFSTGFVVNYLANVPFNVLKNATLQVSQLIQKILESTPRITHF